MGGLIVIGVWLFFVIGWIINIVKIIGQFDLAITGLMVVRMIGVFVAPLGGVIGWF